MIQYGKLLAGTACLSMCAAAGVVRESPPPSVAAQARVSAQVPVFQVDPLWPKPLPNHWILGSVTGVWVDAQDHIWLVHRGLDSLTARTEAGLATDPPTAETCCAPAPPVLEFDQAGTLVSHWGGPGQGYEWPRTPAGITVDAKGNVWITGTAQQPAGVGGAPQQQMPPQDAHVIKFTRAGRFLLQIGRAEKSEGSYSETTLDRPAAVAVDPGNNEVYVADGYGNRRVVVFDGETGVYKRHWGAYGERPTEAPVGTYDPDKPPARQFRTVSCVRIGRDGMVYVCDRKNDRIQVFRKDGTFVKEAFVSKSTLGEGAVWDIAFSADPQQRFLYVADGSDQKVWVLRRDTLEVVSSVGAGGRWPGHFYGVGNIAVDSKGNLYTGETYEGKRLQKFILKPGAPGARSVRAGVEKPGAPGARSVRAGVEQGLDESGGRS
jgi:DNA-binding beta-propeller fold protein YncE